MDRETERGTMDEESNLKFAEMANPHAWFLTADNLHEQVTRLYQQRGRSLLTRTDYRNGGQVTWDGACEGFYPKDGTAPMDIMDAGLSGAISSLEIAPSPGSPQGGLGARSRSS
jgi:hypothetical protein